MSEEELKNKFSETLKNYELDKKWGQLSPESIYHLFPNEQQEIIDYIEQLQQENQQLKQQLEEEKNIRNKVIEYCQIINDSDYVYSQDEITNKVLQILQNKE